MLNMKHSDSTIRIVMRKMDVSCSERNRFTMSTSDVHRWMMSPVRWDMCQENGRCWMWPKS